MAPDKARTLSLRLQIVAVLALVLATAWALRTPPPPNSDRYDYVGRAYEASRGEGLSALVVYPLRMTLPGANTWPPANLTRPPLWPALLTPLVRVGTAEASGVLLSSSIALLLLLYLGMVGDRGFGGGAGGLGAIAMISSFATAGALWGGGPELALALVTLVLWTWIPQGGGRVAYAACGTLYGVLPLLHPFGWILAIVALVARPSHYRLSGLPWLLLGMVLVAGPWHLRLWLQTGHPIGMVQSYAELARSLTDPGGLGPYRGLEAHPTLQVLQEHTGELMRLALHRLKVHLLHLDGWLSWPFVALALIGAGKDPKLALRDAGLLGIIFLALSFWSAEPRILVAILPVACVWVGAGLAQLSDWQPRVPWLWMVCAFALLPWITPVGASRAPTAFARDLPHDWTDPPAPVVDAVQSHGLATQPFVTESAVVAWRARRGALFLPDRPATLAALRARPPLSSAQIVVLLQGRRSVWTQTYQSEWDELLARSEILVEHRDGAVVFRLPSENPPPDVGSDAETAAADTVSKPPPTVDREHRLTSGDVPSDLNEIQVPPATRKGLQLRPAALEALRRMESDAAAAGAPFRVVSAYRSYERQQQLYQAAVEKYGPDQSWVAPPGASEHQLGTTVDVADAPLQHVLEQSFGETEAGVWLREHCTEYGFVISYTDSNAAETGYQPEPWHFRYVNEPEADEEK